jgi:molybdenum ABC transporter molybdate-binding protein
MVYCAAGLKNSVEAIAQQYEKETGTTIQLQYGGSGLLLSNLQVAKQGDIFIAADESYIKLAKEKGLVAESLILARQSPILAVKAGNPKKIATVEDLLKPGIKYAIANPEAASIGKLCQKVFTAKGEWDALAKHVTVMKPTVSDVANDLAIGTVDAAFVWDATVAQTPGTESVALPEFAGLSENATAGILRSSKDPTLALHFARYLAAPDKGGIEFKKRGYTLAENDLWQDKPQITFFIGSVNRRAVEKLLSDFSAREGVGINTVYNGCGILCATMRAMAKNKEGNVPDAYYACDICFVQPVADLYPEAVMLSDTDVVIAVKKGNPLNIHSLADLAQPGLRLGLANYEQSSLGFISKRILEHAGLYRSVSANARSQVPVGDLLANQLAIGSLDAIICYTTNALPHMDKLDTIPINDIGARAVQPFSVAKNSPNRQLVRRLLAYLQDHKEQFLATGFRWRIDQTPMNSSQLPQFGALLPPTDEITPNGQVVRTAVPPH